MELNRKTVRTLAALIAFGVLLSAAAHNAAAVGGWLKTLLGVLSPVVTGLVIAFILNIPVTLMEKHFLRARGGRISAFFHRFRRPVSITASLLLVLAVLAGAMTVVIPQTTQALASVAEQMKPMIGQAKAYLAGYEEQLPDVLDWLSTLEVNWQSLQGQLGNFLKYGLGSTAGFLMTAATSVFGAATNTVLALILAINILAGKERLGAQVKKLLRAYIPQERAERLIEVGGLSNRIFGAFLTGQVAEALILAVLCYLGMLLFRFPYAFLTSVVVAVSALIPLVGAFVAAGVGALLILTVDPMRAVWFVVFFVALQQLEGNLIYPRVVGTQVGLPSMWVLVAITVGGGLMGVGGMLFGVPACAVLYELIRRNVNEKLERKGIMGN